VSPPDLDNGPEHQAPSVSEGPYKVSTWFDSGKGNPGSEEVVVEVAFDSRMAGQPEADTGTTQAPSASAGTQAPSASAGTQAPSASVGNWQQERLLACFQKALGHEIPNQLVALQGLARMLATELAEHADPSLGQLAGQLADLTRRLDGQVRALAELGRLLRDPGLAEAVPLKEAGREAAAEVNVLFRDRSIEYHFINELPTLTLPRRTLHLALVQLLRNSVEAVVSGRTPRLEFGSRPCAEGVEVWIADNGRGMSEDQGRQLFEPFVGRHPERHGLGLFLVRQLVAGWGGAIRIQSRPGEGTTVTLLFRPRKSEE